MTQTIKINKIAFVEKVLIPVQDLALFLEFVANGKADIDDPAFLAGMLKAHTQIDQISATLFAIKEENFDNQDSRLVQILEQLSAPSPLEPLPKFFDSETVS